MDRKWLNKLKDVTLKDIHIKELTNGYVLSVEYMLPSYGSDVKGFVYYTKAELLDVLKKIFNAAISSP